MALSASTDPGGRRKGVPGMEDGGVTNGDGPAAEGRRCRAAAGCCGDSWLPAWLALRGRAGGSCDMDDSELSPGGPEGAGGPGIGPAKDGTRRTPGAPGVGAGGGCAGWG
eukprot:CAMPEP_0175879116 /NCGR_PEP_ID=MMETSP0107_2-20121207/41581_1 /TAXON_ID=195067 ORGANISM="Goniomonas pacifica, Strain CCMP1869" /NCGR_SAMPLE_ID=MMETSP0107_2 /ASSEMBLY_ACC=CAM_ASM_000203 /LENGTH=109 /DNA_ID=CAMNT_0017198709 /DNA_START=279 /DNA_END=608 /DNA_ORIENTATION=+